MFTLIAWGRGRAFEFVIASDGKGHGRIARRQSQRRREGAVEGLRQLAKNGVIGRVGVLLFPTIFRHELLRFAQRDIDYLYHLAAPSE